MRLDGPDSISRRHLLMIALFAGFWGAHTFAIGARREGYLYLVLCITIVPAIAALFDIAGLVFAPHESGRFRKRSLADAQTVEPSTITKLKLGALVLGGLIAASLATA